MIRYFLFGILIFAGEQSYSQTEWEGSAWDVASGFNYTKGSRSNGKYTSMKPNAGWELSCSYSSNFRKNVRLNLGISYSESNYSVYQIPDSTYFSLGVLGEQPLTKFNFRFIGPFVGLQFGNINKKLIYYVGLSIGLNTAKGSVRYNTHFSKQMEKFAYDFQEKLFTNIQFYGGFGYRFSKFIIVAEPFIQNFNGNYSDNTSVPFQYDFKFRWMVYGLRIKLEFPLI